MPTTCVFGTIGQKKPGHRSRRRFMSPWNQEEAIFVRPQRQAPFSPSDLILILVAKAMLGPLPYHKRHKCRGYARSLDTHGARLWVLRSIILWWKETTLHCYGDSGGTR